MSNFFSAKDPEEEVILTFRFANDLAAISSSAILQGPIVVEIFIHSGIDANPAAILNGDAQLDASNTSVLLPVKGGLDGVSYKIKVVCDTNIDKVVLSLTGTLPVKQYAGN